jgi:hypothetical protein
MLGDLLAAWASKNLLPASCREIVLKEFREAALLGRNASFVVGRELTPGRKWYLVHCFDEELFVFALQPHQARKMRVSARSLTCRRGGEKTKGPPDVARHVQLDGFEIDNRTGLPTTRPITGECRYRVDGAALHPYAVVLVYDVHDNRTVTSYCYPDALLVGTGTLRFSFTPMAGDPNSDLANWSGTTAFFLRLETVVHGHTDAGQFPLSNVLAALVDVRGRQ